MQKHDKFAHTGQDAWVQESSSPMCYFIIISSLKSTTLCLDLSGDTDILQSRNWGVDINSIVCYWLLIQANRQVQEALYCSAVFLQWPWERLCGVCDFRKNLS